MRITVECDNCGKQYECSNSYYVDQLNIAGCKHCQNEVCQSCGHDGLHHDCKQDYESEKDQ